MAFERTQLGVELKLDSGGAVLSHPKWIAGQLIEFHDEKFPGRLTRSDRSNGDPYLAEVCDRDLLRLACKIWALAFEGSSREDPPQLTALNWTNRPSRLVVSSHGRTTEFRAKRPVWEESPIDDVIVALDLASLATGGRAPLAVPEWAAPDWLRKIYADVAWVQNRESRPTLMSPVVSGTYQVEAPRFGRKQPAVVESLRDAYRILDVLRSDVDPATPPSAPSSGSGPVSPDSLDELKCVVAALQSENADGLRGRVVDAARRSDLNNVAFISDVRVAQWRPSSSQSSLVSR